MALMLQPCWRSDASVTLSSGCKCSYLVPICVHYPWCGCCTSDLRPPGDTGHNQTIDDRIKDLRNDPDVTEIRKNQQQVDVNGNAIGKNRPDIQYDKNGVHHNEEYDTTTRGSQKHQRQIPGNDPNSRNTYWMIDKNGKKTSGFSQC